MVLVLDCQCFMSPLIGTTSSSNTMVPGNDGHHDTKIKDSNMEDRYRLKCCTILCVKQRLMREVGHRKNVWYVAFIKAAKKHNKYLDFVYFEV